VCNVLQRHMVIGTNEGFAKFIDTVNVRAAQARATY
jgi:hypothetical protein